MMLKKPTEKLAPSGVGDNLVSNENNSTDADYLNGVIHVVVPFILGYFSVVVGLVYYVCAFGLYCTKYRAKSQGFFGATALVVFFVSLMAIPTK